MGMHYPEKNAETAYTEYKALFAFAEVVASTWPPPPSPVRALNIPGHKKQTKPSMMICVRG